jgi:hypothetical protein
MISWTETVSFTALSSSQTASDSLSYFGSSVEGILGFDCNISSSAINGATTEANNGGATYISRSGFSSRTEDHQISDGMRDNSRSASYSIEITHLANGARTTISQSTFSFGESVDTLFPDVGGSETNTTITNSSTATTRSSQTTTQTTANFGFTDTTTTASTRTTGTLTSTGTLPGLTVPTTRSTTAQATTTRFTQSSLSVTGTTSVSSGYDSWDGATEVYAGLGRITNILPESNEVVWAIKPNQTTDTTGDLTDIAISYTSSFIFSSASAITARPTAGYNAESQDPATLFFETGETYEGITKTSTISAEEWTTLTLYSLGASFPLVSYTPIARTQTTTTQQFLENSFAFVSGTSTTMATIGAGTMSAKFGGHTHQVSFLTTSTASRWTDGLALGTYSTTFVGDGNNDYGTNESITEEFGQGASIQGEAMSYGLYGVGGSRNLRDVESSYFNGWAIPAEMTSAALQIGLSPEISARALAFGAALPRVTVPLPLATFSLGVSTGGSSTWSYGALGVSRTSVGTGTAASAVTTSASWTKGGEAITQQAAQVEETRFNGLQNIIQRAGGIPAIGDSITAIVAPGKYLTAAGSSSGTVRYGTPQSLAGTKQTAFMAQDDFVAAVLNTYDAQNLDAQSLQQPVTAFGQVRNLLPYSSTFFPI